MDINLLKVSNDYAQNIISKKYCSEDEKTYEDICKKRILPQFKDKQYYLELKEMIIQKRFIFGGSLLQGLGSKKPISLSNCAYLDIKEDSIEGIMDFTKMMARAFSVRQGVGTDISILRPKNEKVNNSADTTSGSVSFLPLFSDTTEIIGIRGRRGALIVTIEDWHPDVMDFILCKSNPEKVFKKDNLTGKIFDVNGANLSVKLSDKFMKAVEKDNMWDLVFPDILVDKEFYNKNWNGDIYAWKKLGGKIKVFETIKARDMFTSICESSYRCGDPAMLFWDNYKNFSTTEFNEKTKIRGVNPCGEQSLSDGAVCFLSTMVLSKYVKHPFSEEAEFDFEIFKKDIIIAVKTMDGLMEDNINSQPFIVQKEKCTYERRMGLGITALADCMAMLGYSYNNPKILDVIEKIMIMKCKTEWETSLELAKQCGVSEAFKTIEQRERFLEQPKIKFLKEKILKEDFAEEVLKYGLRNIAISTIQPNGTLSIVAGNTSSGIEPIFALKLLRKTRIEGSESVFIYHQPLLEHITKHNIDLSIFKNDNEIKEKFNYVEASDVSYKQRLKIQQIVQKYTDTAISSTLNLANKTTINDIYNIFLDGWKNNLKGLTIFRDGCEKQGVLIKQDNFENKTSSTKKGFTKLPNFKLELEDVEEAKRYIVKWKDGIKVYINVTEYDNIPIETFVSLPYEAGINGSNIFSSILYLERKSDWDIINRLISLLLRYNISLDEILTQLEKSSYSMFSLSSIMKRVLKKYKNIDDGNTEEEDNNKKYDICPECGKASVIQENGCDRCLECGYSRCD